MAQGLAPHQQQAYFRSKLLLCLVALVVVAAIGLGLYRSSNSASGTGVNITIVTGAGGMPPGYSPGELLKEKFTVVLTEPFPTLDRWREAKVLYSVTTTNGSAFLNAPAGKYGVYYTYKGKDTLYSQLNLGGQYNPGIKMSQQGPWQIDVPGSGRKLLQFSVNSLPV